MNSFRLFLLFAFVSIVGTQAQPASPPNSERVTSTIGTNRVSITITGGDRVIQANGIPDHPPGKFPRLGNPNSVAAQNYNFHVPLTPQAASSAISSARWWFGIAVNGVPFEPGTAEFWNREPGSKWVYEAKSGFINLGLDEYDAHVQPNGAYHYHGLPPGLIARLGGDERKMLLVGWAADGFPIYTSSGYTDPRSTNSPLKKMRASYRLKSGERPDGPGGKYDGKFSLDYEYVAGLGDLDQCNGRFGVTPEFPAGIYHYYLTEEFPYISRLFRGTPDPSFQKRGPGPGRGGPGGPGGPGSGPPNSRRPPPPGDRP